MRYLTKESKREIANGYLRIIESLQFSFLETMRLAPNLKSDRAKSYLTYGLGRRLSYLRKCVTQFRKGFRHEALGKEIPDEIRNEQTIYLNFFFICLAGALDNLAWTICHERGLSLGKFDVTLLKGKKLRPQLSQPFQSTLSHFDKWLVDHVPEFRDPSAHRIMPYVIPYILFKNGKKCYDAYYVHDFESSPRVPLHPQVICDIGALCKIVDEGLNELAGYKTNVK